MTQAVDLRGVITLVHSIIFLCYLSVLGLVICCFFERKVCAGYVWPLLEAYSAFLIAAVRQSIGGKANFSQYRFHCRTLSP